MSHLATNWAFNVRGLKPATKIVLLHLADCHNRHTGQCNPRQSTLSEMCEMSRSTLNLHISKLEKMGLITRHESVDSTTKRQRPTSYTLAISSTETAPKEGKNSASENRTQARDVVEPCPKIGPGSVSENRTDPCPKNEPTRVRNSDTIENLGREPGKEPVAAAGCAWRDPDVATAGDPETWSDDRLLSEVMSAVGVRGPSIPTYWMPPAAAVHVGRWRRDLNLDPASIVDAARASRARHAEPPAGPKALDGAMRRLAAELAEPAMTPAPNPPQVKSPGGRNDRSEQRRREDVATDEYLRRRATGEIDLGPDPSDPFAGR